MTLRTSILIVAAAVLSACQTTANGNDAPARISNPTEASRSELSQAVNAAMRTEVLLADDALTTSSILIIERRPPSSMSNLPATGRNMNTPVQFRLVTDGSRCILVDTRDESRHLLENVDCVAE